MKRLALVPFMVLALAGCGNKGPLVHPTPPAVPMEEMPMSATTAPAAPTDATLPTPASTAPATPTDATPPAETTPPPPPPGGD
jgi:predicted small lipoprotein YifL